MSTLDQNQNSLPEEFREPPVNLNFYRVLILALLMGIAVIVVTRVFPEGANSEKLAQVGAAHEGQRRASVDESIVGGDPNSRIEDDGGETSLGERPDGNGQPLQAEGENDVAIFSHRSLPKLVWHSELKRAFVSGPVINMRDRPGGKIVGQLLNGEELSIIEWPKGAPFLKVGTTFARTAYVSADLVSSHQFMGVFSTPPADSLPFDSLVLESAGANPSSEFHREYENFKNLLKGLPTKKSFDYSRSNLKYILLASTSVIFPTEPSSVLRLIRSVSAKPAVFFERAKSINPGPLDPELEIRADIPVRRVFENGSAKSTRFEKVLISSGCPEKQMAAVTDDGTAAEVELLIFDVNKKVDVKFSSKPHRGNPSFKWAYADLNGDSWQDAAFYFGGATGRSPVKFIFIAHNIDGVWQIHKIGDYSGAEERCLNSK